VQNARPRFPVPRDEQDRIAGAFFAATRNGDLNQLKQLLADNVVFYGDGGGKRPATINPIYGLDKVARLFGALVAKAGWDTAEVLADTRIGGLPGRITLERDALPQAMALEIDGGKIVAIYVTRNPDKLAHLSGA
jgi:RNA polymerase sigma-70 factor (ECF subfamily)